MTIPKSSCGCTSVCTACATNDDLDRIGRIGILMSGPPKSKEEKKLEKLRREAEKKR